MPTTPSYNIATAVQETTAKWWLDIESVHDGYQDKFEAITIRKLMKFAGKVLYMDELLTQLRTNTQLGTRQLTLKAKTKSSDRPINHGLL